MNEKSLIPAIRFAGFADAWERRKVKCVAPLQRGFDLPKAQMETGAYPVVMSNGVNGYHVDYIVKGPGVITGRSGTIGRLHYIESNFWPHNTTLWVTNFYGNIPLFIYYIYQNIGLENYKSGSGVPTLNRNDIHDITVTIPDKKEQQSISSFFKLIDDLITLHQRKHEKLLHIKKSMLDKMFPKDGELFPEVRFARYTDAWERRKLGELGKARSGIGFPDAEQGGTEGLPFFKVSDMNISGNEHEMTKSQNYVSIEQIQRKKWTPILEVPAMFFAKVGAAVLLNRKRLCRTPFLLDNNTMAYSVCGEKWNVDFAKALFDTVHLPSLIQVGALPSYNARDVESLDITLPSMEEQSQIGHFFRSLDRLITLHQRKLEKLQNIKKACLEKMFV